MGLTAGSPMTDRQYQSEITTKGASLAVEAEDLVEDGTFETVERAILDTADESVFPHEWFDKYEATMADFGQMLVHGNADPTRYGFEEQIVVEGDFADTTREMARYQFLADVIDQATALADDVGGDHKPDEGEQDNN